jgi:hypothetical protein
MLGLLVISESEEKKGYGKLAYQAIEGFVLSWKGTRKVRIGVIATNGGVLPFWRSLGFVETGARASETIVLEKTVFPPVRL